jgi:hypothetical protein
MARTAKTNCVIFGAGALGLGFLGPELTPDCRVTYLDIPAKADLLEHLTQAGSYVFNETGLSMRPVEVRGVNGRCLPDGTNSPEVKEALDAADIVFTAVGEPNLPQLALLLASAASRRAADRPLRVLCAENGVEIARNLQAAVEKQAGRPLGASLLTGDTVMGRMCKIVSGPQAPLRPPAPGLDWAVVAEPFFGIPVEQHAVEGLPKVPAAIEPQGPERFHASEDVKMLSHNGLHATLACIGYLKGVEFFDDLRGDPEAMEMGRCLLVDEAGAALLRKHGAALGRNEYLNYCDSILRRVTCPVLHDPIARGVRGIMRKLTPWERLVYSVRAVAAQGIEPAVFATGLAAGIIVAQRAGETTLSFNAVLAEHCRFDPVAEAQLVRLIEESRKALAAG